MLYKDMIDYGRSEIAAPAIYGTIIGDIQGLICDRRSDRLIKQSDVIDIINELGGYSVVFDEIGPSSRRMFIQLKGTTMLVELSINTESRIDKQINGLISEIRPFYEDEDEELDNFTGEIVPVTCLSEFIIVNYISLFYKQSERLHAEKFWKKYDANKFAKKKVAGGIVHIVQTTQHGHLTLKATSIDIKTYGEDIIDSNYNDSLKPAYQKVQEFFNAKGGGFSLLAGKPGTGKSSFITHLISIADKFDKKFVVVPPAFGSAIVEPNFMGFCLGQLSGSILVIEDAETILKSRSNGSENPAVTNILNLTDGILSSVLDIRVVATVNVEEDIDKALLRKGRLKVKYNFDLLETEKSNKLLKKLGSDRVVTEPHTLADLYNIAEQVNFDGTTVRKEPMGFRR